MARLDDICERLDRIYDAITSTSNKNIEAEVACRGNESGTGAKRGLWIDSAARLAFWAEHRLTINAHADFTVLELLVNAGGALVTFGVLERSISPESFSTTIRDEISKAAPQDVKDAVQHIRAAMRAINCKTTIKNVRGKGYRLDLSDE